MMTRNEAIAAFNAIFDAGFDVELHARRDSGMSPGEAFPLRAHVLLELEELLRLGNVLGPLGLDYRADSLRHPFAGRVTVNIFQKGARSYAV